MSGKQFGFCDYELAIAKNQPKREKLLVVKDAVKLWAALIGLIKLNFPRLSRKGSRPPYQLSASAPVRPGLILLIFTTCWDVAPIGIWPQIYLKVRNKPVELRQLLSPSCPEIP
jgi:hypothetical protein